MFNAPNSLVTDQFGEAASIFCVILQHVYTVALSQLLSFSVQSKYVTPEVIRSKSAGGDQEKWGV